MHDGALLTHLATRDVKPNVMTCCNVCRTVPITLSFDDDSPFSVFSGQEQASFCRSSVLVWRFFHSIMFLRCFHQFSTFCCAETRPSREQGKRNTQPPTTLPDSQLGRFVTPRPASPPFPGLDGEARELDTSAREPNATTIKCKPLSAPRRWGYRRAEEGGASRCGERGARLRLRLRVRQPPPLLQRRPRGLIRG